MQGTCRRSSGGHHRLDRGAVPRLRTEAGRGTARIAARRHGDRRALCCTGDDHRRDRHRGRRHGVRVPDLRHRGGDREVALSRTGTNRRSRIRPRHSLVPAPSPADAPGVEGSPSSRAWPSPAGAALPRSPGCSRLPYRSVAVAVLTPLKVNPAPRAASRHRHPPRARCRDDAAAVVRPHRRSVDASQVRLGNAAVERKPCSLCPVNW